MRWALVLLALAGAALMGLVGSEEPPWALAVLAVIAFPLAAAAALSGGGSRPVPAGVAALAGGLLIGLLLRLAFEAPGWETAPGGTCDAASTGVQNVVLWGGTLVFAMAVLPVAATLARLVEGRGEGSGGALAIYPLVVAVCGLALIGAGFATSCA